MKILVIQLRRIGDVLLTTPAVTALRKKFPAARIDFLVEKNSVSILGGNPEIDQILVYDKKHSFHWLKKIFFTRYDLVVDFLNNPRSALITFFSFAKKRLGFKSKGRSWAYNLKVVPDDKSKYVVDYKFDLLRPLGIERDAEKPRISVESRSLAEAKKFFQAFGPPNADWVGISPTSRRSTRVWKKEYFAQVSDYLIEKYGVKVIFFWGPGEEKTVDEIFSLTRFPAVKYIPESLEKLVAFISCCQLFISNDNGPKHLAQALDIPTICVFGPSSAVSWTATEEKHRAIQSPLRCSPCFSNQCPLNTLECMEKVKPEDVYEIIATMVREKIV